jgi:hypothetical protein
MSEASEQPDDRRGAQPVVRFPNSRGHVKVFAVGRLKVTPFLTDAEVMPWGWFVRFAGAEEDLVRSGVATPYMFEGLSKTGNKTAPTEFGDQFHVRRRPKGRFELEIFLHPEPAYGDPGDPCTQKAVWWRRHGAEVDAVVGNALERMRKPRREAKS